MNEQDLLVNDGLGDLTAQIIGAPGAKQAKTPKEKKVAVHEPAEDAPAKPYLQLATEDFVAAAGSLMIQRAGAKDILSRAVLFRFVAGGEAGPCVQMEANDGTVGQLAVCPVRGVNGEFPSTIVLDLETLYQIAQYKGQTIYLVYEDGSLYVTFLGGQVYVPVYTVQASVLEYRRLEGAEVTETPVFAATLQRVMETADVFLSRGSGTGRKPFLELGAAGAITTTETSVLSVPVKDLPSLRLRQADLRVLRAALRTAAGTVVVRAVADRAEFVMGQSCVAIPLVQFRISEGYRKLVGGVSEAGYRVDSERLQEVLALLLRAYQSSGLVQLSSDGRALSLSGKNYGGKVSSVVLAVADEALPKFSFQTSSRHLAAALVVFRGDVILGTESDVLKITSREDDKCVVALLAKGSE